MTDEYIGRNEVIRLIEQECEKFCRGNLCKLTEYIENAIQEIPKSANVQLVKHGKWVKHINHRYDYDREQGDIDAGVSYTCSLCSLHGFKGWHFCPNCGADMEGDSNDD